MSLMERFVQMVDKAERGDYRAVSGTIHPHWAQQLVDEWPAGFEDHPKTSLCCHLFGVPLYWGSKPGIQIRCEKPIRLRDVP